jgi:hypothetical protein
MVMTASPRQASAMLSAAFAPLRHQRLCLRQSAVVNHEVMARLQQIERHTGAHTPKPNESHVHNLALS